MRTPPTLNTLFAQLGLDSSDAAIEKFILNHAPIADDMRLFNAPCWSKGQSDLLRESLKNDADWASVVDLLSTLLRK